MSEPKTPPSKPISKKEWQALPDALRKTLIDSGAYPRDLHAYNPPQQPYTRTGIPSLKGQFVMPELAPEIDGVTLRDNQNPSHAESVILMQRLANKDTHAHELEHALANQGLGAGSTINSQWDKVAAGGAAPRAELVRRLIDAGPYLVEKWGLDPKDVAEGYFSPRVLGRPDMPNFLYEQMATLSALEQRNNKRLADDPYIRDKVFKKPAERETYDALTGLRQTRLDAKDLPPYTRQPEKTEKAPIKTPAPQGMWEKVLRRRGTSCK